MKNMSRPTLESDCVVLMGSPACWSCLRWILQVRSLFPRWLCVSVQVLCLGAVSEAELVTLLVQNGLFDSALSLCHTFKLDLSPVFEGLAFK